MRKISKCFSVISVLTLISVSLTTTSNADEGTILSPKSTMKLYKKPNWTQLNETQMDSLAKANIKLEFANSICKFEYRRGCVVLQSKNQLIRRGQTLTVYSVQSMTSVIQKSSYSMNCKVCNIIGAAVTIGIFIVAAPALTPALLIASTYGFGAGAILGYM